MNGLRKLLVPLVALTPLMGWSLSVDAKSAIIIDANTGKVLWEKDADTPRYPASTTKIMTGLLLLERCRPDEIIVAPSDVTNVKEASMHLKPFEKVPARDMLYAIMLRSANDGCYAIAQHIGGSVPGFAKMMNDRAKEIGCTHTHFNNPNGLNDKLHVTTAHDLALIAREAMKLEPFREVVKTRRYEIQRSINQKDRIMVGHNKWLPKDPTADGIKTGFTVPAGHCYVGSATRNGYRVITVVLNSPHWQQDHQEMLNWAFANHKRVPLVDSTSAIPAIPVPGGERPAIAVGTSESLDTLLSLPAFKSGKTQPTFTTQLLPDLKAPIRRGQILGTLSVRDSEGFEQKAPLEAREDLPEAAAPAPNVGGPNLLVWGGAILTGTIYVRRRAKRSRFRVRQAIRSRSY